MTQRIKFSEKLIQHQKPVSGKQIELTDVTGLILRVSSGGTKSWVYFYRYDGRTRRLTLGKYPKMSLSGARKKYAEMRDTRINGTDPATKKISDAVTVNMLSDEFYNRYLLKQRARPDIPKQMLDADIKPTLGRLKIKEVTPRDIVNMVDKITDRGSYTQANRVLSLTKQLFSFSVSRGLSDINPASEIRRSVVGGKEKPRDRTLTMREIQTIWFAMDNETLSSTSPQILLAIKILILTGVRSGEIRTAEWQHINLSNKLWVIPKEKTKTGVEHKVHLASLTIKIFRTLKTLAGTSEYVMPSPVTKNPFTAKAISKAVNRLQSPIGIDKWTPHDLRRTFSTQLSHEKVQPHIVEKCLNHKLPKIMATYNKDEFLDERKAALNKWSKKVEGWVWVRKPVRCVTQHTDAGQTDLFDSH